MRPDSEAGDQHFVLIFGPPAVGKMTVAQALARRTGFKVFHNHMTIELVLPFFAFGTPEFGRLVNGFRRRIFEEVAASDAPGLVFTYVWALDGTSDKAYVDGITALFDEAGWAVHFAELEARQGVRLERNRGESRLREKASKRDLAWSDQNLRDCDERYRLNSSGTDPFFYPDRHFKLETSALTEDEAAQRILDHFGLPQS